MNNFEFYNPVQVVFGDNALECVGTRSKELGSKALIVSYTDRSFYGDLFDDITASLSTSGVDYVTFYEVTANPTIAQCEQGVAVCKENACDLVIGIGGGSAMDCAKMIAAGSLYPHDDIRKMVSFSHSGDSSQIPPEVALPTIMIPTLPATGSEMNPTAVVTDEIAVKKSYLWAPSCLYPKYALVDPSLSKTLPKYQTACAAFDTMAHMLEGYFNGDTSTDLQIQDNMQVGVMKAVYDTLPKVIDDPSNVDYRGVMQWASAIALNGWVLSGTYGWAPMHQMGHVLGARFHATHGATLSTMILAWMKYFAKRDDNERYVKFASDMFGTDLDRAIHILEEAMKSNGVQVRISEFGATEEDIQQLVDDVVAVSFGDDGMLASNPPMSRDDIYNIYMLSL